jgi:hypothetical protein
MSRFYSEYELKKNENKLNDDLLNANYHKKELKLAINEDYHRINIDSAKKKAVLQNMDYDNFHKMVLGADLKGLKGEDITNIKITNNIMNSGMINNSLKKEVDFIKNNFVLDNIQSVKEEYNLQSENNTLNIKTIQKKLGVLNENKNRFSYFKELIEKEGEESIMNLLKKSLIDSDFFLKIINFLYLIEKEDENEEVIKDNSLILSLICALVQNIQSKSLSKFISKNLRHHLSSLNVILSSELNKELITKITFN